MNNRFKNLTIASTLFIATLLSAENSYEFQTKSLVAVEGGFGSMGYEDGTPTNNVQGSARLSNIGLKMGAETRDFRILLSGRYYFDSSNKYDYLTTAGAELQYLFNVSKHLNLYMGVNGGISNLKFRVPTETFSRSITAPYMGVDLGTNLHLGKSVDLELGGRVIRINDDSVQNGITYHIGNVVSAYGSLIFKWQMD